MWDNPDQVPARLDRERSRPPIAPSTPCGLSRPLDSLLAGSAWMIDQSASQRRNDPMPDSCCSWYRTRCLGGWRRRMSHRSARSQITSRFARTDPFGSNHSPNGEQSHRDLIRSGLHVRHTRPRESGCAAEVAWSDRAARSLRCVRCSTSAALFHRCRTHRQPAATPGFRVV